MRIALVHSYYSSRQPSGENVVVDAQAAALADAGHDVHVVARRTDDEERRPTHSVRAAWTVASGLGADPTDELLRFRPDVVHVHNLFPNFGTRWLTRWSGPVVATLHNFRPMCAAGTLYRDGATCTACPDGDPTAALRHACYRESRVATLPLVVAHRGGLLTDPVVHRADALVTLTEAAASVYRRYGVDAHRLHVVPNFVDAPPSAHDAGGQDEPCWVYVGRLSEEKGIEELVQVWPANVRLDVYGDGPLARRLARLTGPNVHYLGSVDRAELRSRLPGYVGLVLPSRWIEGLPTVLLEAYAAGVPCVAVEGSGAADVVSQHGGGLVMAREAGTADWAEGLARVAGGRREHSEQARATFERRFTRPVWLSAIETLYASVGEVVPVA